MHDHFYIIPLWYSMVKKFESRKCVHVISKLYYNEVYYEGTKLRVYSLNTFLATV